MQQPLIADACHRPAGVAAQRLGALHVVGLHLLLHVGQQLLGVHLCQRQVDDALNAERQTQHQHYRH